MTRPIYIAVDLGAGSGRVFLAGVEPGEFYLEEIHRFHYPPVEQRGHLRWDFAAIFNEIKVGLHRAGIRSLLLERPVNSLGVDSWGVDYGLLDENGQLLANPVCYRDHRTMSVMERVFAVVPRSEVFEKTGIQFLNFNTLFQLYSEGEDLRRASKMLLMPDLVNFFLTGKTVCEYTNATTTQMVNADKGDWDQDLLKQLELPTSILPKIIPSGSDLGSLRPEIGKELQLGHVSVIAPSTHDTGSAVTGAPLGKNWAYISSGTWSLIGIELDHALINDQVERHNFTNEGGAYGTFRFLKNVMGLWIFESCRREWKAKGIDTEYDVILRDITGAKEFNALIFPDDPLFLNPPCMLVAIAEHLSKTGQEVDESPAAVSKMIFDSLALRYASVLKTIESLTGKKLEGVQILGGGGRNRYLNQMTANASGLPVKTGLVEATVVGNVLVQAVSSGRFDSLTEARRHVSENVTFEEFLPETSEEFSNAARRYVEIERRFI